MIELKEKTIAAEKGHWYHRDGRPCYQMPRANGDGMRATTITDARALRLVPSVTTITGLIVRPGLQAWKDEQLLIASQTLPRNEGESLDDYCVRVKEDAKAQGVAAREMGSQLHEAIEKRLRHDFYDAKFELHIEAVMKLLKQHGIDLENGQAEHSFASVIGYGGKVDYHNRKQEVLVDFKSKKTIDLLKKIAYFEDHALQLAAYAHGIFGHLDVRALNVFIGVEDKKAVAVEWSLFDLESAFEAFKHLLSAWRILKNFP